MTRDADLDLEEDEAEDLLAAIESELQRRRRLSDAVRLEIDRSMSERALDLLARGARARPRRRLRERRAARPRRPLAALRAHPAPRSARRAVGAAGPRRAFAEARGRAARRLLRRCSASATCWCTTPTTPSRPRSRSSWPRPPTTRTCSRSSTRSTAARAPRTRSAARLIRAAQAGKQVVTLVELKARFDEETNIEWARALEQAGVHVVYGLVGLKTHAQGGARGARASPTGSAATATSAPGNYHPLTARLYEDLGVFSADPELGADLGDLFNYLTGCGRQQPYRKILVAPDGLRPALPRAHPRRDGGARRPHRDEGEQPLGPGADRRALRGVAGRRRDRPDRARRLLPAARACPGSPSASACARSSAASSSTRASSASGARRGGRSYFIGSADLMPRNLDKRVEVVVPIDEPAPRRAPRGGARAAARRRRRLGARRRRELGAGARRRPQARDPAGAPGAGPGAVGAASEPLRCGSLAATHPRWSLHPKVPAAPPRAGVRRVEDLPGAQRPGALPRRVGGRGAAAPAHRSAARARRDAIAEHLAGLGIARVVAAPELRCQQTVEPLAQAARRSVHVDERLAADSEVEKALEVLPSFDDGPVVLCSHAETILGLLRFFELGEAEARDGRLPVPEGLDLGAPGLRPHADERHLPRAPRRARRAESSASRSAEAPAAVRAADPRPREHLLQPADRRRHATRRDPPGGAGEGDAAPRRRDRLEREDPRGRAPAGGRGRPRALRGGAPREGGAAAAGRRRRRCARRRTAREVARAHRQRDRHAGAHPLGRGGGGARSSGRSRPAWASAARARSASTSAAGASSSRSGSDARGVEWAATLPLGVVRLHGRFVKSDPMTPREARAIDEQVRSQLSPHLEEMARAARPALALAAGGTARALARLLAERERGAAHAAGRCPFPSRQLVELRDRLVALAAPRAPAHARRAPRPRRPAPDRRDRARHRGRRPRPRRLHGQRLGPPRRRAARGALAAGGEAALALERSRPCSGRAGGAGRRAHPFPRTAHPPPGELGELRRQGRHRTHPAKWMDQPGFGAGMRPRTADRRA